MINYAIVATATIVNTMTRVVTRNNTMTANKIHATTTVKLMQATTSRWTNRLYHDVQAMQCHPMYAVKPQYCILNHTT
jgi:hypothetical protein